MSNVTKVLFEDTLRIEGINCKGFGVLPKFVMLDSSLTMEAKAIYAYFCSYAGNGSTAFPSRSRILSELGIGKNSYYRHFSLLTKEGYIETKRKISGSLNGRNIYTLVSNPKKFQEHPEDTRHKSAYSRIRFSGLKAAGFGIIPKAVMTDERLSIKSKVIYAYFCSFAGSGSSVFPKVGTIKHHLRISENTYYKYFKALKELNYISAVQRHVKGKLSVNDYYLNDNPDTATSAEKRIISTCHQNRKNRDIENQPLKNEDIKNGDNNINKVFNKNKGYNKHSLNKTQQTKSEMKEFKDISIEKENLSNEEIQYEVENELLDNKAIPKGYAYDARRTTAAVHFMTEWETLRPGFRLPLDQAVFDLFNDALINMCLNKIMTLKGSRVSSANVIDRINSAALFHDDFVDISAFSETAMSNFKNASLQKEIRNPLGYMQSCIWDSLLTHNISDVAGFHCNFDGGISYQQMLGA